VDRLGAAHKYPRLASFARSDGISVLEVMQVEDLDALFFLLVAEAGIFSRCGGVYKGRTCII
jgi:hypothetical protein